jgi:hypothetical protein
MGSSGVLHGLGTESLYNPMKFIQQTVGANAKNGEE